MAEGAPHEVHAPSAAPHERGTTVLGLGEQLTVLDPGSGALALSIGVDAVSADLTCTGPAATPAVNGHLIAVHLRATTGPGLSAIGGAPAVGAGSFTFLAADGSTHTDTDTASAQACLPGLDAFPGAPLGPGQEAAGVVVLDVPAITGTLVLAPQWLPAGGAWTF